MEFLSALSCLYGAVDKLKSHFEDIFLRPLKDSPNTLALCRENKRLALKRLEVVARESMHAWITCVNVHIGKMLGNIQSKYDYSPKESPKGEVSASPACDNACKALLTIANTVRLYQSALSVTGMNIIKILYTCIYIYTYRYKCIYKYIFLCIYSYVYTYTYTHI
jgi:hypothetical protein